jgi:tRNA modification GTPase
MRHLPDAIDVLIIAPATAGGAGARAIVRMAGGGLDRLLNALFTPQSGGDFAKAGERPRLVAARLGPVLADEWGELDLEILHWPGPAGPMGGPLAEVQLPASTPLVDAVVAEACRQGARLARGGEFSLRSFLAGRLDLLQAEAVLAVVDARSPAELSAALDRMAGGAGRELKALRDAILDLLADIEAVIDFSDEHAPDAIPVAVQSFWGGVETRLSATSAALEAIASRLAARDTGEAGRLPRVVIAGPPNIGKSSLFNALVGHEAALVADEAGTTRDWIAARLEEEGVACLLVDVAGVDGAAGSRDAANAIDREAAARAAAEAAGADLLVVCRDAADEPSRTGSPRFDATRRIDVITRCDRAPRWRVEAIPERSAAFLTSSRDGTGIDGLRRAILREVAALPAASTGATVRMRVGIDAARQSLAAAATIAEAAQKGAACDEAIVAAHLGRAIAALGEVTGAELGNDLIDRIFARHCIGK